ncbi:MAG: 2-amino-4-hydroxy-6-hydroxymethyldihydropteridine diphosphokinase [Pirellulales bacterium]|nr:2-amino-4-hydroxy-6-hydroxymethyldihydropteridine diphosphokinase [Pirellulales bacterium]
MSICLIGLGANLGDRVRTLQAAVDLLAHEGSVRLLAKSRWHETLPVGGPPGQPPYLNGAATLETTLTPETLLERLQTIERALGRARGRRWGPRTIDLDLLLHGEEVLDSPRLTVPHPRMAWRRFVLAPAAEVAASMVHPTTSWTIGRLLAHLDAGPDYVAIAGGIGAGKTSLARRLARACRARLVAERLDLRGLGAFYADPSSHAWATELQFLSQRAGWLAGDDAAWSDGALAVSDFWLDQSRAFARVWLRPEQFEAFEARFEQVRGGSVRPKLTILLDVSAERLLARIRRRGRPQERPLDEARVGQIAQGIAEATRGPDVGPVLRLTDPTPREALREATAAVAAMTARSR